MPLMEEKVLAERQFDCERKKFTLQKKANSRGKFVRVIEDSGGKHGTVIIPLSGVDEFVAALQRVAEG